MAEFMPNETLAKHLFHCKSSFHAFLKLSFYLQFSMCAIAVILVYHELKLLISIHFHTESLSDARRLLKETSLILSFNLI